MKTRLARPSKLIDIGRLGLSGVTDGGDHLVVGALTRHADLENDATAKQHCPILAHTAGQVGDRQVRHRGTIGGSCAHGDPASDLPTICRLLDATFVAQGPGGTRQIAAADFFKGFFDDRPRGERTPDGDPHPQDRRRRLELHQVPPAGTRLGDGGCRGRRQRWGEDRVHQHGADHAPRERERGRVRQRWRSQQRQPPQPRGRIPRATRGPAPDFRRHLAQVLTGRALAEAGAK